MAQCATLLEWANATFPSSIFFAIVEADHHACRRELPAALAVIAARV